MEMTVIYVLLIALQLITVLESKPASVQMPSACEGKNYCFEISPDYPESELKIIFDGLHMRALNEPAVEIAERNGERQVCASTKTLKPIYEVVDEEGDVRFVAQLDDRFVQNFTIIECVEPGRKQKEDEIFTQEMLESYNLVCEQTMSSPRFLVLTFDRQNVEFVSAKGGIPMGCSCRLR